MGAAVAVCWEEGCKVNKLVQVVGRRSVHVLRLATSSDRLARTSTGRTSNDALTKCTNQSGHASLLL